VVGWRRPDCRWLSWCNGAASPVGRIDPAVSRRLCFYVFTVPALGIVLGTIAATMDQFGLLAIPVLLIMMLLSGGDTGLRR
jgi:hypothetical protein